MSNMMSGFGRIVSYAFNSLDMTSAANDVIVIRHMDGTLRCSPFNVRFGKVKVLRPQDKVVSIEVNGQLTTAVMKMGSEGEAFWLEPVEGAVAPGRPESPVEPLKSPPFTGAAAPASSPAVAGLLSSPKSLTLPGTTAALPPPAPPSANHAALHQQQPQGTLSNTSVASDQSSRTTFTDETDGNKSTPSWRPTELPTLAPTSPPGAMSQQHYDPTATAMMGGGTPPAAAVIGNTPPPPSTNPTAFFSEGLSAKEMAPYGDLLRSFASTGMMPEVDDDGNLFVLQGADGGLTGGGLLPDAPQMMMMSASAASAAELSPPPYVNSPAMAAAAASTHHHPSDVVTLSAAMLSHDFTLPPSMSASALGATPKCVAGQVPTPVSAAPPTSVSLFPAELSTAVQSNAAPLSETECTGAEGTFEYEEGEEEEEKDEEEGGFDDEEYDEDEQRLSFIPPNLQRSASEGDEALSSPNLGPQSGGTSSSRLFFRPTLTPIAADLEKLNLKEGCNRVRYITQTSLRGTVVVDANIYYWPSDCKIVVSDIDGTVTKSDVWGHLLPLIGRDWTHPGICGLYSKVERNGYKFLYLTARSIAQQEKTSQFLWGIEQDGDQLPRGPVLTAPDRFFTALTQEVSKKSHEFKIACLKSVLHAFPKTARPFYAGFGNRIGDVISYTATHIPKHKIFIIDPNSTLHVCRVKQTYKNLSHMVDVTFPPLKPSAVQMEARPLLLLDEEDAQNDGSSPLFGRTPPSPPPSSAGAFYQLQSQGLSLPSGNVSVASSDGGLRSGSTGALGPSSLQPAPGSPGATQLTSTKRFAATSSTAAGFNSTAREEEAVDPDYNYFNFWRIAPEDLVSSSAPAAAASVPSRTTSSTSNNGYSKSLQIVYSDYQLSEGGTTMSRDGSLDKLTGTATTSETPVTPQQPEKQPSGWSRWWGGGKKDAGSSAASTTPLSPKIEGMKGQSSE